MVSKKRVNLYKKKRLTKKANKSHMKGGNPDTIKEIRQFIEQQLTKKRTVSAIIIIRKKEEQTNKVDIKNYETKKEEKNIEPVPWVWELLSKNNFFNKTYLPALAKTEKQEEKETYKKKNALHREFSNLQRIKNPNFYLMNDPDDKTQKSLIATKKETFYDKSPQQFYDWWLSKQTYMDMNAAKIKSIEDYPLNDEQTGTETIISIMEVVVINCMTHVVNSYIKYGFKEENDINEEEDALKNLLDTILFLYKPNATYNNLINFILWFAEWYRIRVPENNLNNNEIGLTNGLFQRIICTKLFFLPMSTGLTYEKSIYMYSIPVLYFSIVNEIGHGELYQPYANIAHDIAHSSELLNVFVGKSERLTLDNLKTVYTLVTQFFMKIYDLKPKKLSPNYNEEKKKFDNLCYVLFSYLHESNSSIFNEHLSEHINQKLQDFIINDRYINSVLPISDYGYLIYYGRLVLDEVKANNLYSRLLLSQHYERQLPPFIKCEEESKILDIKKCKITANLAHVNYLPYDEYIEVHKLIVSLLNEIYNTDDSISDNMKKAILIGEPIEFIYEYDEEFKCDTLIRNKAN